MRQLVLSLVLASLVWLVGLVAFITTLPQPATGPAERNDAVIVYTGGGGARIAAGMTLLADGAAARLLISGVHPDITRETLADLWPGEPALFECCVDLGWEARSTTGNANEAAKWAAEHNAARILLVTSEFHMPRALAESRRTMPDAIITPRPVASGYLDNNGKPTSRKAWTNLAGEYTKYILARIKALTPFAQQ